MITLYAWPTPNGLKAFIMLEELELPYDLRFVDIRADQQFAPDFLAIAPNNKIPAIVDDEGPDGPLSVFESGAILQYLAEKTGRLLAPSGPARYKALEWLHWQIGGEGPMLGQLAYFALRAPEKLPLAITRFQDEARRLLGVLDRRLQENRYLAGEDYSIADIAAFTWTHAASTKLQAALGDALSDKRSITRWLGEIGDRPAVQRAMAITAPG